MWLVLAEDGDDSAAWAAQQLWLRGLSPLRMITGAELSGSARWAYRHDRVGPHGRLRLADGTQVDGADVRGVVNRLTGWYAPPARVAVEDLDYAACEYAALLLPFLTSLRCPVVNRPEPVGAAAGSWSPLRWRWQAHQAGLPLAPVGGAAEHGEWVLALAGRIVAATTEDPVVIEGCGRLSKTRGDALVEVTLQSGPGSSLAFVSATQLPDLRSWGDPLITVLSEVLQ